MALAHKIVALVFAGGLGIAVAVPALPACKGIPDKTCTADKVSALELPDDGGPEVECTRCLQTHCCDLVGRCQDDPNCTTPFHAAHECVIDGGGAEEAKCTNDLAGKSKELYACARASCGDACEVPHCDVNPSIVLFDNASCDRCIGGACCNELNSCYANRGCKLVIECVVKECAVPLGSEMGALAAQPALALTSLRQGACSGGAVPPGSTAPGPCITHCLDLYAPPNATADDSNARCLAFGVYACGATNGCGPKCNGPDAPFDAGADQ